MVRPSRRRLTPIDVLRRECVNQPPVRRVGVIRAVVGRSVLSWLGALVLGLLGSTELAVALHQLSTPHNTCVEHQESVHGHGREGPRRADSAWPRRGVALDRPEAGDPVHLHAHCGVPAIALDRLALRSLSFEVLAPSETSSVLASRSSPAALWSSLLRLAPKTSPPPSV